MLELYGFSFEWAELLATRLNETRRGLLPMTYPDTTSKDDPPRVLTGYVVEHFRGDKWGVVEKWRYEGEVRPRGVRFLSLGDMTSALQGNLAR